MSLRFSAVKVTASGTPAASTSRWSLEPARARMWLESTTPRDQSIRPAAFEVAQKFAVHSLPHPCALPLPKPPTSAHPIAQPICRGTIRQGTPLTSTNTIAVNALSGH
jgi:hypothetical protein